MDGGLFARALLLAVDGDDHRLDVHLRFFFELGQDLAQRLARGHHVLDDAHLVAVFKLLTDEEPAFAVVFDFLPVEAEADVYAVIFGKGDGGRDGERDALVGGADERLHRNAVLQIALRIVFAELGDLRARAVLARIDEVGRLPAAL